MYCCLTGKHRAGLCHRHRSKPHFSQSDVRVLIVGERQRRQQCQREPVHLGGGRERLLNNYVDLRQRVRDDIEGSGSGDRGGKRDLRERDRLSNRKVLSEQIGRHWDDSRSRRCSIHQAGAGDVSADVIGHSDSGQRRKVERVRVHSVRVQQGRLGLSLGYQNGRRAVRLLLALEHRLGMPRDN